LEDLPPGEKADVIALQRAAREAGSWRDVSAEDMADMMSSLEAKWALVKKGICAKPLSQMATVHQVHNWIESEVSMSHTCYFGLA
jgi:hypothetical protein